MCSRRAKNNNTVEVYDAMMYKYNSGEIVVAGHVV